MGEPVTIVGLHAQNFKRLVAADISAGDAPLVTVGGQNEAGKSSVLDAVAVVLGGAALAPKVPIRRGQKTAVISADLGDLKITRKFRLVVAGEDGEDGERLVSTLEITNADGSAKFASPQAMLDRLLGGAPFHDPLAFAQMRPADRREAVRRVVGLDFSVQDARRRKLLDDRLVLKRRLESAERSIEGVAPYADVPEVEVDPADLLRKIERAEDTHRAAAKARHMYGIECGNLDLLHKHIAAADDRVEKMRQALKLAEDEAAALRAQVPALARAADEELENLKLANDARVDAAPLKQQMAEVAATNKKIKHNDDLRQAEKTIDQLRLELATVDEAVAVIDAEKRAALEGAEFPVEGMSFSDDDVLLGGLPFDQASTSQKLRAGVAMALARAGELRVLLVKAGNDLDQKNLALLGEYARERGAQVWVERVADDPRSVTVFVEDGRVVQP